MSDMRISTFQIEVQKVMQHLHNEFAKLQTGRANASLVEQIPVEAYAMKQPLIAVAGISIQDARTILIQPWDKSVMGSVEKALQIADLGASPVNDGVAIRLSLPPMTEERRKQLTKVVSQLSEDARISVRQARQTALDGIKEEKDEDMRYTLQEDLQKEVDSANAQIDTSAKKKEEEVMTV